MATFPLYQPEYGFRLPRTHMSDVDLPYYTFVKLGKTNGSDPDKYVTLAGEGDEAIGVVIPEVGMDFMVVSDENGLGDGMMPRTGYKAGKDYPQIHVFGVVHVKLGEQATAGEKAVVGTDGLAAVFVPEAVAASADGLTDAQVDEVLTQENIMAGIFLDSGSEGDYVRIFMGRR